MLEVQFALKNVCIINRLNKHYVHYLISNTIYKRFKPFLSDFLLVLASEVKVAERLVGLSLLVDDEVKIPTATLLSPILSRLIACIDVNNLAREKY